MRTESKLLAYKSEGLPADDLSMENGTVILESTQTCLVINHAQQALEWLKTHLTNQHVTDETTTGTDERFQTTLELAARFGETLIISEVDRVELILHPPPQGGCPFMAQRVCQVSSLIADAHAPQALATGSVALTTFRSGLQARDRRGQAMAQGDYIFIRKTLCSANSISAHLFYADARLSNTVYT